MAEKTNDEKGSPVEQQRLEQEQIEDLGSIWRTRGKHAIHCLTVVGQVEGHVEAAPRARKPPNMSMSSPSWWRCRRTPASRGCWCCSTRWAGMWRPGWRWRSSLPASPSPAPPWCWAAGTAIGIPLAVSARRSFIVPTATMTIHPVRHSGMILGVPQTMRWFEQMQERITGFVAAHSGMTEKRYTELMLRTGELVMDVGTVLDGRKAVREKLIDQLGGISDALEWLYQEIEKG